MEFFKRLWEIEIEKLHVFLDYWHIILPTILLLAILFVVLNISDGRSG